MNRFGAKPRRGSLWADNPLGYMMVFCYCSHEDMQAPFFEAVQLEASEFPQRAESRTFVESRRR
jgi:hypothetical protein